MLNWTIEKINLHLKYTWKLSRNATDDKINFYIKVNDGKHTGMGEVAPNIRYLETPEMILAEFGMMLNNELSIVRNVKSLIVLLNQFKICKSLFLGIETAYIDLYCKSQSTTLYQYLNLKKPEIIHTAFTIPIMDVNQIGAFFLKYDLYRFKYIKVKVDSKSGFEMIKEIDNVTDQPLIIDANEAWMDEEDLLNFFQKIEPYQIEFVEQPMPSTMEQAYVNIKSKSPFRIFADESLLHNSDFASLKQQFHGVNIKLMKSGGIINAQKQLKEAKMYQLKTMIGCMVETSLGISYGMLLAAQADYVDLDSFMYLDNDPLKLISEQDGILIKI